MRQSFIAIRNLSAARERRYSYYLDILGTFVVEKVYKLKLIRLINNYVTINIEQPVTT